tara:strand:- start:5129 stop:5635 length:507 start_codon:yes stop_codon:yes gene_type:complete
MKERFKLKIVPNKSKTYMLPFVGAQFDFDLTDRLINTYLSFEEGDDEFCMMYQWSSDPAFLKFEGMLMKHHLFIGHVDYGTYTVYKFKLSRNMQLGKEAFIKGEYTKFSDDHKKAIMKYLNEIAASNAGRISQIMTEGIPLSSDPPKMENEIMSNNVKEIKIITETFV